MCKAPVAGLAKTRLIPVLGARGAARLHRALAIRTIRTAIASRVGDVTVWCAPDTGHRFFRALARAHGLRCLPQPTGDLGERMLAACRHHASVGPVLIVGTDCAALSTAQLRAAAHALDSGDDTVFIPAEDGGYVLAGLRRPHSSLFEDVPWSTSAVMAATRDRARAAGLRLRELAPSWDVDLPEDLPRLGAFLAGEARAATDTREGAAT